MQTQSGADAHMNHTFKEALAIGEKKGHSVRILNPSRDRRISSEVSEIVSEAIQDAMSKIEDLVYRNHITEGEGTAAVSGYSDFADAWEEYCDE